MRGPWGEADPRVPVCGEASRNIRGLLGESDSRMAGRDMRPGEFGFDWNDDLLSQSSTAGQTLPEGEVGSGQSDCGPTV